MGRNQTLSLAELKSFFNEQQLGEIMEGYIIIKNQSPILETSPQKFLDRLGGTIKILKVLEEDVPRENLETVLINLLKHHFEGKNGKWIFGLTFVPENLSRNLLRNILLRLKKKLREEGHPIRFVNKNFKNLSHVTVWNEKLTTDGLELSLFSESRDKPFAIAKTVAIQNFKAYSLRDYEKPFRDPKAGMLPPKLAQIMINLAVHSAAPNSDMTIVDPFCGTGTILAETLLMGYNAIGFDANTTMVEGAEKNVKFICEKLRCRGKWGIEQKDATKLSKNDFPKPCAIVTESSLGPPLSQFPSQEKLERIMKELEFLHINFFKNLGACIETGTPIVITFPVFREKATGALHFLPLLEKIEQLGYSKLDLSSGISGKSPALLQRGTLLYDREDQIVGREIVRFIRK